MYDEIIGNMDAPFRIGISGWMYDPWKKHFYPDKLPAKKELYFASRELNSIEINGTFYSLQRPSSFERWYDETPESFQFSLKGPRFITHIKRLKDVEIPLANFFSSGVLALKEKLGPILWQFPPKMLFRPEQFEEFFKLLPRTTQEAAILSRKNDGRIREKPYTKSLVDAKLKYAVEIRHPSFENPEFIDLLRKYNIALVFADTAGRWPYMEEVTSDFVYLRLHGDEELYVSGYSDQSLKWWAKRITTWTNGLQPKDAMRITDSKVPIKKREAYAYFDNDVKVFAPFNAKSLFQLLNKS
jgi:uncharacterized protein YecE (DUF72 family)